MNIVEISGRPKNKLVQLAMDVSKVKQGKLSYPMFISEKYDGILCVALKHQGELGIFSRTGEQYTSLRHIESQLSKIMQEGDVIIFEAWQAGIVQSIISGYCRDTKHQHDTLVAQCHTYITLDEFVNGGTVSFASNDLRLESMIKFADGLDRIVIRHVAQVEVHSMESAMLMAEKVWENGGEGCVLRSPSSVYEGGKRNQSIIKLKQSISYDLEVVGMEIGKGKYADTLGTLTVRWINGRTLSVSGMTDADRRTWWSNPSHIIGKIVEVMGMRDSSKGLLREPRYKGTRHDLVKGEY